MFNGKDLAGWKYYATQPEPLEAVWSVQDGIILCKGAPVGVMSIEIASALRRFPHERNPDIPVGNNLPPRPMPTG